MSENNIENKIALLEENLHKVELKLEIKISELRTEVGKDIHKLKFDMVQWMISLWIGQLALFLGLIFRK